jgi:leucyl/phenylalanyl-tRNA--protein transferase
MHPVILDSRLAFPDPRKANEDGLVALGGDLSVERLLLAYRSGIFPWTVNPISWWSPNPRGVFELATFHVPRRLAQLMRQCVHQPTPGPSKEGSAAPERVPLLGGVRGGLIANPHPSKHSFVVTRDRAFRQVMEGCAAPARGRGKTWISPQFINAYTALHQAGHAHSVECWLGEKLVGGIYGVHVGGLFAGESMFHRADNASKIALVHLIEHLRACGFALFDIQMVTPATDALGAAEIPRAEYLRRLAEAVKLKCEFR